MHCAGSLSGSNFNLTVVHDCNCMGSGWAFVGLCGGGPMRHVPVAWPPPCLKLCLQAPLHDRIIVRIVIPASCPQRSSR